MPTAGKHRLGFCAGRDRIGSKAPTERRYSAVAIRCELSAKSGLVAFSVSVVIALPAAPSSSTVIETFAGTLICDGGAGSWNFLDAVSSLPREHAAEHAAMTSAIASIRAMTQF